MPPADEMNNQPDDCQREQDMNAATGNVKDSPDKQPAHEKDHEQNKKNITHFLRDLTALNAC